MFRFTVISLLTVTVFLSLLIKSKEDLENYNQLDYDLNEDYGCIHENHSQYDDGDSLNLHLINR